MTPDRSSLFTYSTHMLMSKKCIIKGTLCMMHQNVSMLAQVWLKGHNSSTSSWENLVQKFSITVVTPFSPFGLPLGLSICHATITSTALTPEQILDRLTIATYSVGRPFICHCQVAAPTFGSKRVPVEIVIYSSLSCATTGVAEYHHTPVPPPRAAILVTPRRSHSKPLQPQALDHDAASRTTP